MNSGDCLTIGKILCIISVRGVVVDTGARSGDVSKSEVRLTLLILDVAVLL